MAWDGSGNVNLIHDFTADRDAGDPDNIISADKFDAMFDDMATMLEACLNRNSENVMAGNLDLNGNDLILDVDNDTYLHSSGDDNFELFVGAAELLDVTATLATFVQGNLDVGVADTTPGILKLYGGGTGEQGAEIRVYNNADDDGTVEYYTIVATDGNGNLDIGRTGFSDFFITAAGAHQLAASVGTVNIGTADSVPGVLSLFGGGAGEQSGELRWYNNADDDGTVDYWYAEPVDGTGDLAIGRAGQTDFTLAAADGKAFFSNDITASNGIVAVGINDDTPGVLSIFGGGTGEASGLLRLYNNVDDDGNTEYWELSGEDGNGDFVVKNSGGTDRLRLDDSTGALSLSGYTGGPLIADVNGDVTAGYTEAASSPATTTSGPVVDFLGEIPSWARHIIVGLEGVSTSGTNELLIELEDAGGIENTNYVYSYVVDGTSGSTAAAFQLTDATVAASTFYGMIQMWRGEATGLWHCSATITHNGKPRVSGGSKQLTQTLTGFRLITVGGTDNFDAGQITVHFM